MYAMPTCTRLVPLSRMLKQVAGKCFINQLHDVTQYTRPPCTPCLHALNWFLCLECSGAPQAGGWEVFYEPAS